MGHGLEARATINSEIERQLLRIFDALFHAYKKGDRFLSIDSAMIITQREIHHRTNLDFSAAHDRALLNRVHAENSALRRIEDWCAEQRSIDAAVRDRERATLQIFNLDFTVARPAGVLRDIVFQLRKRLLVCLANHRHDESTLRADGDSNVVEMILDEIVAFNSAVDRRH